MHGRVVRRRAAELFISKTLDEVRGERRGDVHRSAMEVSIVLLAS